jgi:hypothetical protein
MSMRILYPRTVSVFLLLEETNQSRGLQGTDRVQAFAREVGVQSGTRTGDAKLVSLAVFGRRGT